MNLSLHEKATFRGWAESMMGHPFGKADLSGPKRFNVKSLLGQTCMLKIEHTERDGKTSAKVTNLISPPEGIPEAAQVNECVYFTLDPTGFNAEIFGTLSPCAREKIEKSKTYKALQKTRGVMADDPRMAMAAEIIGDEIPF